MTSYSKSSFVHLYLLSWILFIANKIPILSRITTLLKLYYGKTSIWRILVWSRKAFVVFNAFLGVISVYTMIGSPESILASMGMIGTSYMELFGNSVRWIFDKFLGLFDTKIVPKAPTYPGGPWSGPGWFTKPVTDNGIMDIGSKYKDFTQNSIFATKESVSWYRDWTWSGFAYYGLALVGAVFVIGTGVLCYSYISTVYFPGSDPSTPPKGPFPNTAASLLPLRLAAAENIASTSAQLKQAGQSQVHVSPASVEEIELGPYQPSAGGAINAIREGATNATQKVKQTIENLNPLRLLPSYESNSEFYYAHQRNINTANYAYYPYTPYNPNAPIFKRVILSLFGETHAEEQLRIFHHGKLRASLLPSLDVANINEAKEKMTESMLSSIRYSNLAASSSNSYVDPWDAATPALATHKLGLGLHQNMSRAGSPIIWNKLASLPPTPIHTPALLALPLLETASNELMQPLHSFWEGVARPSYASRDFADTFVPFTEATRVPLPPSPSLYSHVVKGMRTPPNLSAIDIYPE